MKRPLPFNTHLLLQFLKNTHVIGGKTANIRSTIYQKRKIIVALIALLIAANINVLAQNKFPATGAAGIGTTTPNASSLLDIVSTSKGFLAPRMTITQRNAILTPAIGLLIYQTDRAPGFYYYTGTAWASLAGANTSLSNLMATSINQSLNPATTNVYSLGADLRRWSNVYAQNGDFTGNVNIGGDIYKGTSKVIAFNADNSSVGIDAYPVLNGSSNTAFGYTALHANATGNYNTATGKAALFSNTKGSDNTATGNYALAKDTSGSGNTATGSMALFNNTNGIANTSTGNQSMMNNTTGSSNTADGQSALMSNTSGYENTALGVLTLASNTTGKGNVAVGSNALFTSGATNYTVAIGDYALSVLNGGVQNVAVGSKAGVSTKGSNNSYLGFQAGYYDNASDNTAIGNAAGWTVANGNQCTYLGSKAGPTIAGLTNTTAIGYNATPTASNQVRLGSTTVTSIGGAVSWSSLSDGRFKRNIKENVPGLAFINMLKPVTYNFDLASLQKFRGEGVKRAGDKVNADESLQEKILHTGFIAQDVEAVAKKMNYDFDGVDAPKNDKDPYGIRYAEFVVPLVKSVQELSKLNDEKQAAIDNLTERINRLEQLLSTQSNSASLNKSSVAVTATNAALEQNAPNPYSSATTIRYILPQHYNKALIVVTDQAGKTVQTIPVTGAGKGSVQVNASTLASGNYRYSFLVDNTIIATKQMMIAK